MSTQELAKLRRIVWRHYQTHGRHDLPWRQTTDPYHILVSEVMLQQTQVGRVIPKYHAFMVRFPTVEVLAQAPLREVLIAWQGLGYNRRAKMLHDAIRHAVAYCGGKLPMAYEDLMRLPGIGPYTAGAVCVFAHNEPHALVETNIRTVLFHHLYAERVEVKDEELRIISRTLCPKNRAREWYWAMMDYGAHLKGKGIRMNGKNPQYRTQSQFQGSDRYIRGAIIRFLADGSRKTEEECIVLLHDIVPIRVSAALKTLMKEGLLQCVTDTYCLAEGEV